MENKIELELIQDKIKHILSKPTPKILISKQMEGGKYILENNIIVEEIVNYNDYSETNEYKYYVEVLGKNISNKFTEIQVKSLYTMVYKYFDDIRKSEELKKEA